MDAGFYSADYLRAWIRSAQLRSYLIAEVGEDWWRNPATGEAPGELFAEGTKPSSEEIAAPHRLRPARHGTAAPRDRRVALRYTAARHDGAHSSSGLGHRPLTAAARVRIPYGPFDHTDPGLWLETVVRHAGMPRNRMWCYLADTTGVRFQHLNRSGSSGRGRPVRGYSSGRRPAEMSARTQLVPSTAATGDRPARPGVRPDTGPSRGDIGRGGRSPQRAVSDPGVPRAVSRGRRSRRSTALRGSPSPRRRPPRRSGGSRCGQAGRRTAP